MIAFFLGRLFFRDILKRRFASNEIFTLLEGSIAEKPIRSSLYMRYSSFPEFVKNFSLAVMPLHPSIFALAIFIHGVPYSLLWAFIGDETKRRLDPVEGHRPHSNLYEGLLIFSTIFGIIGSPAIVAYWIKDMKKDYDAKKFTSNLKGS